MRTLFLALALISSATADDRWLLVRSGPFEIYSSAGDRAARDRLNDLEQFREALGTTLGKKDLKLLWPLRLVIFKKQPPVPANTIALGRDAYMAGIAENDDFSPSFRRALASLLIEQNTNRIPEPVENGLVQLFSTLQVSGTHITLGAPPSERTRDWARMHLLTVSDAYSGRTRVLINNLEQGADMDSACRNAYEKNSAEIEKQVDAYLQAGTFSTTSVFGRAISPARDFHVEQVESAAGKLATADLQLAAGALQPAGAAYTALHGAEAAEGLGFIALANKNKDEAVRLFKSAIESGSKNARAYVEIGGQTELRKAAELNPLWAEPDFRLAEASLNPARKIELLKKATTLAPRKVDYWQELAKTETAANQFVDAAKAWAGAERAAANPQDRERIHASRMAIEQQRADFEEAERKRKAEEEARDLQRAKDQMLAEVHAAEAAANKKLNPEGAPLPQNPVWIDEVNGGAKAEGMLQRVDCLGKQAKLVIQPAEGKPTLLLVRDPGQIAISGGGEHAFACGIQKPPKRVSVQYIAKPDAKRGTAGEVTIIEFR